MSARSTRGRTAEDALPGMPDRLAVTPPNAVDYGPLTLDEAISRAYGILDQVIADYPAKHIMCLFSGGGDSSILAHLMRKRVHGLVHVDTTIAIPACRTYVEAVAAAWSMPLTVATPPRSYEELVTGQVLATREDVAGRRVYAGFPGPAMHGVMYRMLKERALRAVRRDLVGSRGVPGEVVYLTGTRWGESARRFRNAAEATPDGAIVWCSPIVWWTDSHMAEYRARYLCRVNHEHAEHRLCAPGVLPRSEVTDHLHMSGDCLCGAYAKPGELDEIGFFYPEVAENLRRMERAVTAARVSPRCVWGAKEAGEKVPDSAPGPLCSRCVPEMDGQLDLFVA